jgi:hypothetical protein
VHHVTRHQYVYDKCYAVLLRKPDAVQGCGMQNQMKGKGADTRGIALLKEQRKGNNMTALF